ncbi:MAG TPA: isoprenylcysteine carboxylmethyltransferase family protein [Vicinamibacterales bacterium]|nr:isoprenylcysteine carboxylmethyltransferase family protein [Vicinamibacterales bacterium]
MSDASPHRLKPALHGSGVAGWLARKRVPLGFVATLVTLILSRPTWDSWRAGLIVALAGEAIRVWAAGHLEKSREVTRSGPYRWTSHPLYVGSSVLALGVVIAARSVPVGVLAAVYMGSTITAAVRTEEAFLRRAFGDTYDRYQRSEAEPMARRFSLARAMRNREYRAIAGLTIGFGLLALKVLLPI